MANDQHNFEFEFDPFEEPSSMSPDERGTHFQDWIDSFTVAPDCWI